MTGLKAFLSTTSAKVAVALALVLGTTLVAQAADYVGTTEPEPSASPTESVAAATESATPEPSASPTEEPAATFKTNGGGAKNIVIAVNQTDGRFVVRGRLALNQTATPNLAPVNLAFARAITCTGCTTFAIAGQIVLYKRDVQTAIPQNGAVAVNAGCNGCFTGAWAVQYVIPVEDTNIVPREVDALARELNAEMRAVETAVARKEIGVSEAIARLDSILTRFQELGQYVKRSAEIETAADSPSPQPTLPAEEPSPSAEASDVPAPTEAPAATETPTTTP